MRPGRLNKRITLTPPGAGVDAWQQPTGAGGTPVPVWASVFDVKVADKVSGNTILTEATLTAMIRFRTDVDTTYTVTYEGVAYKVVHKTTGPRKRELFLYLKVR